MDAIKEYLLNAEIAMENRQYNAALTGFNKALDLEPENIYAHSKAGAICVALGRFEEALSHFGKAMELDPQNGDNAFNYGNACFFNRDFAKAFSLYVQAEKLGCSDDVRVRLYYQMASLCSMRQDIDGALIYFRKCEQSDPTGLISMNPDLISEKLKLHMLRKDYAQARKCAEQLVAAAPAQFKNYMVYFSLLMASRNYDAAQQVLEDAGNFAVLSEEDAFALVQQKAALLVAMAQNGSMDSAEAGHRAEELLDCYALNHKLTDTQMVQLRMTLAEILSKTGAMDRAIAQLEELLYGRKRKPATAAASPDLPEELSIEDLEEMARNDMERIQEQIDSGELDEDLGLYAEVDYDEDGMEIHCYDDAALDVPVRKNEPEEEEQRAAAPEKLQLSAADREKAQFLLLTCHLAQDDFAAVGKLAKILKTSENKYYRYYGIYTEALSERKLTGNSASAQRRYAEAQAFFRSRTFADKKDALASVFRARLYAEQGQYEKAGEIAQLLSDSDRKAVVEYIETCRA